MNEILTQATEKLKAKLEEFFQQNNLSIHAAEQMLRAPVNEFIQDVMKAYYEGLDEKLLADKAGRKREGLVVERKNDKRQILTLFGMISYARTYYASKSGGYCYPVDAVVGLEGYERVSREISSLLCEKARKFSYSDASDFAV